MSSADQYQFERGRLEQYRATLSQRMSSATTAERRQIHDEGEALLDRLEQLAEQVHKEGEAVRNAAASPSAARRYDTALCAVRCVVFPSALWSLTPPAAPAQVGELHQIEGRWLAAQTSQERAAVASDAETLARRAAPRDASIIDIKLPGAVLDEMNTTRQIIVQLGHDIDASAVGVAFKSAWHAFRDEWERFYADHQGLLDRIWYSSYEKVIEYRQRAAEWRKDFEAHGGRATGPQDDPPSTDHKTAAWEKVALGVSVGVGALAALHFLTRR